MFKNTIFRRMTALVLTLALAAAAALPGLAVYPMPIQTASETEAVYLFNADTGKTILNQNAGQQQYVASLTAQRSRCSSWTICCAGGRRT